MSKKTIEEKIKIQQERLEKLKKKEKIEIKKKIEKSFKFLAKYPKMLSDFAKDEELEKKIQEFHETYYK